MLKRTRPEDTFSVSEEISSKRIKNDIVVLKFEDAFRMYSSYYCLADNYLLKGRFNKSATIREFYESEWDLFVIDYESKTASEKAKEFFEHYDQYILLVYTRKIIDNEMKQYTEKLNIINEQIFKFERENFR